MTPPDPALVERFRSDLAAVAGSDINHDARVALAVSGGADSMAMLALAQAAMPGRVIAATVDHRLRRESAAEARMVAAWCADHGVPHESFVPARPITGSGLQAQARAVRYDLLARWALGEGAAALLTAHHADDQAETVLMRLARGVGITGMRGIPARTTHRVIDRLPGFPKGGAILVQDGWPVAILRPLLGWTRTELRALAAASAVPFVDDPSNDDAAFERVRVRQMIAREEWLDARLIARTAAHLAEIDDELGAMRRWLWATRRRVPPGATDSEHQCWLDMADLPRELRRRLARSAIVDVRDLLGISQPAFGDATNIEPLLDAVEAGKAATQAGVMVSASGTVWHFREAPPRRSL